MRKKLHEISLYESLLCMYVIMIHVLSECISGYTKGTFLSAAAFFVSRSMTFAVPAFIMSSGIKLMNKFKSERLEYFGFIAGRIKKIYVPYIVWSIVYYLYFVFYRHWFDFSTGDMLRYLLTGDIAAPFYFIIVIMQFYILMPLWLLLCRRVPAAAGVCAAAVLTVLSKYLTRGFEMNAKIFSNYLVFWVLGCYSGMYYDRAISVLRRYKAAALALGIVFSVIYSAMAYAEFIGIFHSFATELVKLIFCMTAALMYLALMPAPERTDAAAALCRRISARIAPVTFYIYLIHCLVIFEADNIMSRLGITSISQRFALRFIAVFPLSAALAMLYGKISKRISMRSARS